MHIVLRFAAIAGVILAASSNAWGQSSELPSDLRDRIKLTESRDAFGRVSRGTMAVYEKREAAAGRILQLDIVVLHATGDDRRTDPVFPLAGGPGLAAATLSSRYARSWMREQRDIVLVSQRGTGGTNRLAIPPGEDADPMEVFPDLEQVKRAVEVLSRNADLRMYSTPLAMDDLNDVRQALGYDKINLTGGSYGTRAALVYIRRHGNTVRTAILNGVAPIPFTNPLYHAREAQAALDRIFDEVEATEARREAFPELRKKFAEILARFDDGPIPVALRDQHTGDPVTIDLTRDGFCGALRFQLYYLNTSRRVPLMLMQAHEGDFRPFVESAIVLNEALRNQIAAGMLLSVTAAEDVARINEADIERLTKDTFLGDRRVRQQIAACALWPKSELPERFGEPVKSDVPTLILSGTIDPVTPPRWGQVVADNFPNSLHIIAPAAHGVSGPCIDGIQREFLQRGTVEGIDSSCVDEMRLPPFVAR